MAGEQPGGLPLASLRIIDLGVIVAGGELSRLFGDLGAEVFAGLVSAADAVFANSNRERLPRWASRLCDCAS